MRTMILAAGQGKRLRPITNTIPKPLVKVGGKPLIEWHILKLKACGVTDLVVNGAYLKDVLFDYLKDGSAWGVHIELSPEDADGLETAGGINQALPLLGSEPFLVLNGDVFIDGSYERFMQCPFHQTKFKDNFAHLFLTANPQHNAQGDFDIDAQGFMQYGHAYTFSGVAWYKPEAFTGHTVCREPLRPYFDRWIAEGRISAEYLDQPWFDVGTIERLAQIEEFLSNKH